MNRRQFFSCAAAVALSPLAKGIVDPVAPNATTGTTFGISSMGFGRVMNARVGVTESLAIHGIEGVTSISAAYDGGVKLSRAAFPPRPGEWATTSKGEAYLGATPVFTVTADLEGENLPEPYELTPEETAGCIYAPTDKAPIMDPR